MSWKDNIFLMLEDKNYELYDIMHYIQDNLPNKLYRYRCFNDYTHDEISNETVFLSNPRNFNDPLDSLPQIYQNSDPSVYSWGGYGVYALINNWVNNRLEILEKMRGNLGIACFCECCDDFLMWSHYANNHQGYCIEYNTYKLYDLVIGQLFPVLYLAKHPYYTSGKKSLLESIIVKDEHWKYEKEWRIIYSNRDISRNSRFIHLTNCITSLYAGINCKGENLSYLYHVSEKYNIPLRFIELNRNYKLEPEDF
jgi:hypothetical protein